MKIFVNILTLLRIFATFMLPILWRMFSPVFIIMFVAFVLLTDFFDGHFARKYGVQTLFGCLADSLADKVFGIVMILIVAIYYPLYYLVALLEILIALVNFTGALRGTTIKSSFLGKAKTWVLGLSIIFVLITIFNQPLVNIKIIAPIFEFIENNEIDLINSSVFITAGAQVMVIIDYLRNINKEAKEVKIKKEKLVFNFKNKTEMLDVLFNTEYYLSHKDIPMAKHFLK